MGGETPRGPCEGHRESPLFVSRGRFLIIMMKESLIKDEGGRMKDEFLG
jgi:hypothetical protein